MTLAATFILIGRIVFGLFFLIAGLRQYCRQARIRRPAFRTEWQIG
jgi:hypothetical protein